MDFYSYSAITSDGRRIKGLIEAISVEKAVAVLKERSLFVVDVKPQKESILTKISFTQHTRISFGDVVFFTRQLATMMNAGLPLTQSLFLLSEQTDKHSLKKIIKDILSRIEGGSSLNDALKKFPQYFSNVYIALVKAGEAAGMLNKILANLANNLEEEKEFNKKVKGAFVYPTILFLAMMGVVILMFIFVLPKVVELYGQFGSKLPVTTQVLVKISLFLRNFWWIFPIFLIVIFILLRKFKKSVWGRRLIDKITINIPVIGSLLKKAMLEKFCRTLSLLTGAGVPILESLAILTDSMDNIFMREALREVSVKVEKGFALSDPLRDIVLFPPIVSQIVAVGEKTGRLDFTLMKLAEYFEQEVSYSLKTLTTLLEPIIMIIMGVITLFVIWIVISPIWELTASFQ